MIKYCFVVILCCISVPVLAFQTVTLSSSKTYDLFNPQGEIAGERKAQNALPTAKDPLWDKLYQCKISFSNTNHKFSVKLTDDVKALNGQTVTLKGFMYPLSFEEKQKTILLSKRTPVCFFCPPGEPNELLSVEFAKSETLSSDVVTLKGTFVLENKQDEGIFFALKDASVVK